MHALFGRKIENIVDLVEATERSRKSGMKGTVYTVDREVEMTDDENREFGKDFLKDQPWILKSDGGYNEKGEYRCIRVRNVDTGESLLVSSEGFDYPRYIAIEPDKDRGTGTLSYSRGTEGQEHCLIKDTNKCVYNTFIDCPINPMVI